MILRFFCLLIGFFLSLLATENEELKTGVTYTLSGGRFGDNLIAYLHAKWIAYKYNMPLLYQPFTYSSDLLLDEKETKYDPSLQKSFDKIIRLGRKKEVLTHSSKKILYISPYFPETQYELDHNFPSAHDRRHMWPYFKVDWHDKGFRKEIHKFLAPKKSLSLINPPQDRITLALHIREGGGYDSAEAAKIFPWKLPPFSFYIDSLTRLLQLLPDKEIYCFLFTDAKDPSLLVKKIQEQLPKHARISFDYRNSGNQHNAHVLEDFFSLLQFDTLIRPDSNFSMVASLTHDYAIVIAPNHFHKTSNAVTIDAFSLSINHELYKALLQK